MLFFQRMKEGRCAIARRLTEKKDLHIFRSEQSSVKINYGIYLKPTSTRIDGAFIRMYACSCTPSRFTLVF